jgi:DNA segregation ATPase FtsK/SpoIIIE, S-DNA-T family
MPPQNPLWAEITRLLWFTAAVILVLALLSYSPTDPSWSTWSSRASYRNWIGRTGSVVSDLLFQILGLGAFAIAIIFSAHAFTRNRFIREMGDSKLSYLSPVLFLIATSSLLQLSLPENWIPWHLPNAGGITGRLCANFLTYATGSVGAFLISVVTTLVATIIVFRLKVVSFSVEIIARSKEFLREAWPRWKNIPVNFVRTKWDAYQQRKLIAEPVAAPAETTPPPAASEEAPPVAETGGEQLALPETSDGLISIGSDGSDEEEVKRAVTLSPQSLGPKGPAKKVTRRAHTPFTLPPLSMLSGKAESKVKSVDKNWYLEKANILVQKLKDFGVEGEVVHISPGPVITVYEFKPASGVKIKEIANLSDDLTLALSVLSVRIVAPIPGKPVVGIEIPSPNRETVFFKDMVQETPFFKEEIRIPIALGRMASGEPVTADLAAMPHLLVAGATGTGKSVFINTLIASLLYRFSPEKLKMILVDPKMVELSQFEGIAHLLLPVVVDSKKAAMALRWTVDEMERRYTMMHQFGVRHLDAFNTKLAEYHSKGHAREQAPIPYIVVVIDEYADLMAVVPKDVELSIARLAQKARASGIHLVLATQRPSTDVVTGTIKANFPSRISFRVASSVDSKTILDRTGADRLLGQGDMLFHSAGFTTLKRMQGAFISDTDIASVVEHIKVQGEPEYDERILKSLEEQTAALSDDEGGSEGSGSDEENRLYDTAVRLVSEKGEASISLIQRHLRIGYNRAAMLMERMEKEGVVAQSTGTSKRRSVIVGQI